MLGFEFLRNRFPTILSQELDGSRSSCGFSEERSHFTTPDNRLDRIVLAAITNNNANASIQRPGGGI